MKDTDKKKQEFIHFRVSKADKKRITTNAKAMGMNISQYLQHLDTHRNIVVLNGGKELADEIYNFNRRLDRMQEGSTLDIQEIRNKLSETIQKINKRLGE